jgi:hypothetical protein
MEFFDRALTALSCITVLLFSLSAVATDDDYLKMLEQEANGLEVDKSGQLGNTEQNDNTTIEGLIKENWTSDGVLRGDEIPSGLTQDEFVGLLKQNFYGSYIFFTKLNSIDQQTVYYHYTKASPAYLESIRQDILELLKNR